MARQQLHPSSRMPTGDCCRSVCRYGFNCVVSLIKLPITLHQWRHCLLLLLTLHCNYFAPHLKRIWLTILLVVLDPSDNLKEFMVCEGLHSKVAGNNLGTMARLGGQFLPVCLLVSWGREGIGWILFKWGLGSSAAWLTVELAKVGGTWGSLLGLSRRL